MDSLKVTNLAISWKSFNFIKKTKRAYANLINSQVIRPLKVNYHANFAVVRYKNVKFVYIIFYSGHINCTGIASIELVNLAVHLFKRSYITSISSFKVKAIAATAKLDRGLTPVELDKLVHISSCEVRISLPNNKFAGLMLRFQGGGSAQVFYSGKVNFLGARSLSHLKFMCNFVVAIITKK